MARGEKDSVVILGKLRRARAAAGRSQKEIAALVGVAERTLHSWEAAKSAPDLVQLCRWAATVGITLTATAVATGEQVP